MFVWHSNIYYLISTQETHQEMRLGRELFYDDIVHVEDSTYARGTDFLTSTKHLYAT